MMTSRAQLALFLAMLGLGAAAAASERSSASAATTPPSALAPQSFGRLPLAFTANVGQFDGRVRWAARAHGAALYITDTEAVLCLPGRRTRGERPTRLGVGSRAAGGSLSRASTGAVVRLKLEGARCPRSVVGLERLPGVANYLIGSDSRKWRTGIATYRRVRLSAVYPGIDLEYYGRRALQAPASSRTRPTGLSDNLEFDLVVRPGADPRRARMALSGVHSLRPTADGGLIASTDAGDVRLRRPVAYQVIAGRPKPVACRYELGLPSKPGFRFQVAKYDRSRPLVIDPILEYSTLLGGTGYDDAYAVAVDSSGCAYVTGATTSADFPTTPGAYRTTGGTQSQVYVAKLDRAGSALLYSTYLGPGSAIDFATGIAVDATGAVYVAGQTQNGIPTTTGAYQRTALGGSDGFVTKLAPAGDALVWSTYLCGAGNDTINGVSIDAAGAAFVVGETASTNYPTTVGAPQAANAGLTDAFVTKLDASGASLQYSTYIGGELYDAGYGVVVDGAGACYVTGDTSSEWFPVTAGAYAALNEGGYDAFIAKLSPSGTALAYATYLGGYGEDHGRSIAIDGAGAAYICGNTTSTAFPTTAGAFQTACPGGGNAMFVTKLNPLGSALVYSSYLAGPVGASGVQAAWAIRVDAAGSACVAGSTESLSFPVTGDAFQSTNAGASDGFVSVLDASGSALVYSTYLGGAGIDAIYGMALDPELSAYVVGSSTSASFPTTPGAFSSANHHYYDAFASKLALAPKTETNLVVTPPSGQRSETVSLVATLLERVSGAPVVGASVVFRVNAVLVGTAPTNGSGIASVSYTIPEGPARTAAVKAAYGGDATHYARAATATLTVLPSDTSLAMPNVGGDRGASASISATLTRTSNGTALASRTVSFSLDGASLGTGSTDSSGKATVVYVIPADAAYGPHPMAATYAGDPDYAAATANAVLTVRTPTHVYTIDRSGTITESVRLKGWLWRNDTGAPLVGRTLRYLVDGSEVASGPTDDAGLAAVDWAISAGITPGIHVLTCAFSGDGDFGPSSADASLTALRHETKVYVPDRSGRYYRIHNTIAVTAYLYRLDNTPVGGKSLEFRVDGTVIGSAVTNDPRAGGNGRALLVWTVPGTLIAGYHELRADFAGDPGYAASYNIGSLTLQKADLYIWVFAKSVIQGNMWTMRAYVRTLPDYAWQEGLSIEFILDPGPGQVSLGSALTVGGIAALAVPSGTVAPGVHTIRAAFAGNASIAESYGETTATVYPHP